jgi:hypothetical protein
VALFSGISIFPEHGGVKKKAPAPRLIQTGLTCGYRIELSQ